MAFFRADRMIALREAKGFSQSALARLVHVGQSTINRIESGDTKAPREILAIAKALDCPVDYLLDESDNINVIDRVVKDAISGRGASDRLRFKNNDQADIIELDEIDLSYGLGGAFIDAPVSTEKRQFSRAWLRNFTHATPSQLFWTKGQGDSMEPTIRSGETVLVDRSNLPHKLGDGIWAFAWGDIGMIKRLRPRPDGTVEILSDNQLVPPATAADGELHVVGRVIAVIRRL